MRELCVIIVCVISKLWELCKLCLIMCCKFLYLFYLIRLTLSLYSIVYVMRDCVDYVWFIVSFYICFIH